MDLIMQLEYDRNKIQEGVWSAHVLLILFAREVTPKCGVYCFLSRQFFAVAGSMLLAKLNCFQNSGELQFCPV
jgi:hypothetical protein